MVVLSAYISTIAIKVDPDFVEPESGKNRGGCFKSYRNVLILQNLQKHINTRIHCQGFGRDLPKGGA